MASTVQLGVGNRTAGFPALRKMGLQWVGRGTRYAYGGVCTCTGMAWAIHAHAQTAGHITGQHM